jgi:hypothetical protein
VMRAAWLVGGVRRARRPRTECIPFVSLLMRGTPASCRGAHRCQARSWRAVRHAAAQ